MLTSTSEVYGTARYVPIDEQHPLRGQSPYAATKIGADALGESYHRAFGLPVAILRPFNTFGPRQSARAIIPTIISQALTRPVVKLGRLDPRRDLTYVKDTVAGFVAIAGCDAALGRAVNIGRGEDISIGELVERIGRLLGRPLQVESETDRVRPAASEVERLLAGTALAQSLWGWKPRYSPRPGPGRNHRLGPRAHRPVPDRRLTRPERVGGRFSPCEQRLAGSGPTAGIADAEIDAVGNAGIAFSWTFLLLDLESA